MWRRGRRAPGTHSLHMCLFTTEFRSIHVCTCHFCTASMTGSHSRRGVIFASDTIPIPTFLCFQVSHNYSLLSKQWSDQPGFMCRCFSLHCSSHICSSKKILSTISMLWKCICHKSFISLRSKTFYYLPLGSATAF